MMLPKGIRSLLRDLTARGHTYYGPVQVTRHTAIYPCRRCGARFPAWKRCR